MDLQGALKATPPPGIMVGRRPTSLRKNSESMYSFRKNLKITYLNAR